MAALEDDAWLSHVQSEVIGSRKAIAGIAKEHGLVALPSATNFVTIDCGRDGAFAKAVLEALIARDIFVRMPFSAPGNRAIRVSCGRPTDIELFRDAIGPALADAGATR